MKLTSQIAEIVGTHSWDELKLQIHQMYSEASATLIQAAEYGSIEDVRKHVGITLGIARVVNGMIQLEKALKEKTDG